MKLYYWDSEGQVSNFGDMLNPWFWPRVFPDFFDDDDSIVFFGIGTVLRKEIPADRAIVVGSGTGIGQLPTSVDRWSFYAVRGPLTAKALGLPQKVQHGDPAILLPDFLEKSAATSGPAFIPHWSTSRASWPAVCERIGVRFIDPCWPVEDVACEISESSIVLAEAMHGAIVADAYRVPWIPVTSGFREHNEFKWLDWCKGLQIDGPSFRTVRRPLTPPSSDSTTLRNTVKRLLSSTWIRRSAADLARVLRTAEPNLSSDRALDRQRSGLYDSFARVSRDFGLRGRV